MGGAYGHLMHLHEDRDLTFVELKDVLRSASTGRLVCCTEKTDGMNLVFTWDEPTGALRVARSIGDIRRGGMDATALAGRFVGMPGNVVAAFEGAFRALNAVLLAHLAPEERPKVFGAGTTWYSMEVIDPSCPNVIDYTGRFVVFHAHGSFSVDPMSAKVEFQAEAPGVDLLSKRLDLKTHEGWVFCGPHRVTVQCPDDGPGDRAQIELGLLLSTLGLQHRSTIGDFLLASARKVAVSFGFDQSTTEMIAQRMACAPGAPTLTQIKAKVPATAYSIIKFSVELEEKALVRPLERIVHEFAVGLLYGLPSMMVSDHQTEVKRLRREVDRAVELIDSRGNDKAKQLMRAQLAKLGGTHNITSSAEGVVFCHGGKAYKLTGNFSPLNQILGLLKYQRAGVKLTGA